MRSRANFDVLGEVNGPISALVLAAGFGTRLVPLSDEIPKPLAPVGDRPLLVSILEKLLEGGASNLIVNVHHHHQKIRKKIDELNFNVQVSYEPRILGTAGGLKLAASRLGVRSLCLVNGDIWGPLPLSNLMKGARSHAGLTLATTEAQVTQGTVGMGADGRVVRLRGEVFGEEVRAGNYMGLAHAGESCLAELPEEGCLVGDFALPHLRRGGRIATVPVWESFVDVGTPADYLRANLSWLISQLESGQEKGLAVSSDPLRRAYIGSGALVEGGVSCRDVIVGQGAALLGTGEVRETVVLPGATARAPLSRVIVLPSGRLMHVEGSPKN